MDGSGLRDVVAEASAAELRQFIERIEAVRARIADEKAAEKEIFEDLAGHGYLKRPVRTILKERAADPEKLAEEAAVLALYKSALGMS